MCYWQILYVLIKNDREVKIVRTFRLCRNDYTSDLDSCAVWELPSTITDDTMHLTA